MGMGLLLFPQRLKISTTFSGCSHSHPFLFSIYISCVLKINPHPTQYIIYIPNIYLTSKIKFLKHPSTRKKKKKDTIPCSCHIAGCTVFLLQPLLVSLSPSFPSEPHMGQPRLLTEQVFCLKITSCKLSKITDNKRVYCAKKLNILSKETSCDAAATTKLRCVQQPH